MSHARIKDVAAMAGVSIGTVSNVLNRPERRPRRPRAARSRARSPNWASCPTARLGSCKAGRSRIVAYVVLDAANPFFMDVAHGVDETIRGKGLSLFLCNSDQDREREDDYLADLAELRARGRADHGRRSSQPERLELLRRRGIPVVLVDRVLDNGDHAEWCAVGVDDVEGGDLAVEHLMERGHAGSRFIGGPITIPQVADRHVGAGAGDRSAPDSRRTR